jgi:hypothetical protein
MKIFGYIDDLISFILSLDWYIQIFIWSIIFIIISWNLLKWYSILSGGHSPI